MHTFNPTEEERFVLYDVIEKGARKDERKKIVEKLLLITEKNHAEDLMEGILKLIGEYEETPK